MLERSSTSSTRGRFNHGFNDHDYRTLLEPVHACLSVMRWPTTST